MSRLPGYGADTARVVWRGAARTWLLDGLWMSSPSDLVDSWVPPTDGGFELLWWVRWGVSAVSFWSAIVLPLIYLTLLATGIDSPSKFRWFLGLVGLHVITLIVGHSFRAPGGQPQRPTSNP